MYSYTVSLVDDYRSSNRNIITGLWTVGCNGCYSKSKKDMKSTATTVQEDNCYRIGWFRKYVQIDSKKIFFFHDRTWCVMCGSVKVFL